MRYIKILGKQFQQKYWLQTNLHNNVQKYKLFRKQVRVSNQNLSIMKCVNRYFS